MVFWNLEAVALLFPEGATKSIRKFRLMSTMKASLRGHRGAYAREMKWIPNTEEGSAAQNTTSRFNRNTITETACFSNLLSSHEEHWLVTVTGHTTDMYHASFFQKQMAKTPSVSLAQ